MTINSIYYLLLPCRHQRCFRFNLHSVSCCAHVQLTSLVPRNRAWTSPVEHSTNTKTSTRERQKKRARNVQPTWWIVPVLRIKWIGKPPCESCHTQGPTKCAPARPSFQKRIYKVVKSWSSWKAVCCSPQMHSRYHLACAALSTVTALLPALANKHQEGLLHNEVLEVMECGPGSASPRVRRIPIE